MIEFKHALVVGKFYPPHYGHMYLIRTAARRSEKVTVLVMGSAYDSLRLDVRANYITQHMANEGHDNIEVLWHVNEIPMNLESRATWNAQVAVMETATAGKVFDAVFSSENYGEELAEYFGAEHVLVDLERAAVPTSGTAIRNDVVENWGFLPSEVRSDLTVKTVFVGAESTGTTTTSQRVWKHYHQRGGIWARGQWIPEYGRDYTVDKLAAAGPDAQMDDLVWTAEDFVNIAREQNRLENVAFGQGSPILSCDTDSLATVLWQKRYLPGIDASETFEIAMEGRIPDIYFITDHEGVPFVQDGIRDGEHIRANMTEWFKEFLTVQGCHWVLLTGSIEERLQVATDVIDHILEAKLRFTDPI